ncbi:MAG: LysR family transcriptional regulator ArgP [Boseongicola sp.]|nr:LysR family transcriptional regulator ArgP [Boseongicola sp.]
MFEHPHLAALTAILRTGSFEAAAAHLSVTQSAISQRIRALEDRVGAPVLQRTTPPQPTPTGKKLAAHADALARLNAELDADLGRDHALSLRLAINADSIDTWFLPALQGLPDHRFDIRIEDQDHSADLLRNGEVAAAVTTRATPVQGADVIPLGALRYIATASPAFQDQHFKQGLTPKALATAPALVFNEKDKLQESWARAACGQTLTLSAHYLPTTRGFVEAATLGIGWGLNPEPLVRDALRRGDLVALRPDLPFDTPLYWQTSRIGKGALAALTSNVKRTAKRLLHQTPSPSPF